MRGPPALEPEIRPSTEASGKIPVRRWQDRPKPDPHSEAIPLPIEDIQKTAGHLVIDRVGVVALRLLPDRILVPEDPRHRFRLNDDNDGPEPQILNRPFEQLWDADLDEVLSP